MFSKAAPKFDAVKLKSNLKMAVARVRMHQNKRQNNVRVARRELAELLSVGKFDACRVKAEGVLREDKSIGGLDVLVLFVELLGSRHTIVVESKTCPPELKEAVTSVLWAIPRVDGIVELHAVRMQFALKYGKKFCEIAAENEEHSVNEKLMDRLGIAVPSTAECADYLAGVAREHDLAFDAASLGTDDALIPDAALDVTTATGAAVEDASDRHRGGGGGGQRFVIPPIIIPRDDLEARLLALKRQ
jgi:vacuolar protein sorting-associated protein IST1